MKRISLGQFSVVSGERAIVRAKITGNAFVKVEPTLEISPNTFVCDIGRDNIAINMRVFFPDATPNSKVKLTIEGELNGQPSGGPFEIDTIQRTSPVLDPAILLVVSN